MPASISVSPHRPRARLSMGRKKKYHTPEEKKEAARAAQKRYYESHQAAEQAKARERWYAKGSAQRRARKNSESQQQSEGSSSEEYEDYDYCMFRSTEARNETNGPSASTSSRRSRRRTPSPEFGAAVNIADNVSRLYQILRLGGESVDEDRLLNEQARQVIASSGSNGFVPSGYSHVCEARLANISRVVKEACALEREARRRDPQHTGIDVRRAQSLVRSATRHEAFDEELGLFMRGQNGIAEYTRAYNARELQWQQNR